MKLASDWKHSLQQKHEVEKGASPLVKYHLEPQHAFCVLMDLLRCSLSVKSQDGNTGGLYTRRHVLGACFRCFQVLVLLPMP